MLQLATVSAIAQHIALPFFAPEFRIRGRENSTITATVDMPKTPVDKDDLTMRGKHKIGRSGHPFDMQTVTESHVMNE